MTLGELIRQYRTQNNISQQELAEKMGVTDMTVSRMESTSTFRVTDKVGEYLFSIIGPEEISKVDEFNATVRKLLSYYEQQQKQRQEVESAAIYAELSGDTEESNRLLYEEATASIEKQLKQINFSKLAVINNSTPKFDLEFEKNNSDKKWVLDFMFKVWSHNEDDIVSFIRRGYGKCCTPKIHRYSIVVDFDIEKYLENLEEAIAPNNLYFDVSILHYNHRKKRIDKEIIFNLYKDGRGIFDLEVEEKEQLSNKEYVDWSLSLSDPRTLNDNS